MKIRFIITLLLLSFSLSGVAQSAYGRYSSRLTKDGMCYFFRNKKLTKTKEIRRFDYDMTYLDWKDSVTVNFTILADTPKLPTLFKIVCGADTFTCNNLKRFFVDVTKKGYEIRMSSLFSEDEIRKMINSSFAPVFVLDIDEKRATATYSKHSWEKESNKLQMILHLIDSMK